MGMSTHVIGIRPPTAEYTKKVAAYLACEAAGVPIPEAVEKYFNYDRPNPLGMEVELEHTSSVSVFKSDNGQGLDVEIAKLPSGVAIIRFYNSW